MPKAGKQSNPVARVEFEDIYTAENLDKCPGHKIIGREVGESKRWVEVLVRCEEFHPHQERRKVITFEDGHRETYLVQAFAKSLPTAGDLGL